MGASLPSESALDLVPDLFYMSVKRRTERIRDPIHDLIVFDEQSDVDPIAWALVETPEFQRLRRIKQLGVSEYVYPGATHSRFAHSLGVFHNARKLLEAIEREIKIGRVSGTFDRRRARVAALAALVHDIGHGPFSHAFEKARSAVAKRRSKVAPPKKHEIWTAEIVEDNLTSVNRVLRDVDEGLPKEIAELLRLETPTDMYHAIVTSSFDADRLDYLVRDRYMTGAGMGSIDLRWLLDNVRVASIDVSVPGDGEDPIYRHSFCFSHKARHAAEDFLLARYRLYANVYFHKTTRGMEELLTAIFVGVADAVDEGRVDKLGLSYDHPLVQLTLAEKVGTESGATQVPHGDSAPVPHRGGPLATEQPALAVAPNPSALASYLALDDTVVWGAIEAIERGSDTRLAAIAKRLRRREKLFALDIDTLKPGGWEEQRAAKHAIDAYAAGRLGVDIFRDEARLSLYGEVGADDEKAHKRIMIQLPGNRLREITEFSDRMIAEKRDRTFTRFYFMSEQDREKAIQAANRS